MSSYKKVYFFCVVIALTFCNGAFSQCFQRFFAGEQNNMIIVQDGTLWVWGYNTNGQVGDGTNTNRNCPVLVGGSSTWNEASAGGFHCMGIKSNGTLWTWGSNSNGQLGDGTIVSKSTPVQIGSDTNWVKVAAGYDYSIALKSDESLWSWGNNDSGELGIGNYIAKRIPTRIGLQNNWTSISTYLTHAASIKSDGTLWTWGWNNKGQLGDGTSVTRNSPGQVGFSTNWQSVSVGGAMTHAIKTDGTLWGWGSNLYGALGTGSISGAVGAPMQVGTETTWQKVSDGYIYAKAIKTDGSLWGWGSNGGYQLGIPVITSSSNPIRMGTETWHEVSCGNVCVLELKSDGTLWGSGSNYLMCNGSTTGESSTLSNIVCPIALGLDEFSENKLFAIYPNPASTQISILSTSFQIPEVIKIIDLTGKVVLLTSTYENINLEKLSSGIYILQIIHGGAPLESHQFVKR